MRVEIKEDSLKSDGYILVSGDIITVPDDVGAAWCARGWAADTAGIVATGERVVLDASLIVHTAKQAVTGEEVSNG